MSETVEAQSPLPYKMDAVIGDLQIPPATRGKTNFTVDDEAGFSVGSHVLDFIIARSEMHLDADVIIPRLGDTIEVADGTVFEVVYLASDGCWRFSDGIGLSMRIHTKRKQ